MKKIAILLMLLVCACGHEEDYPITDKDFQKGTAGLEIQLYNTPPEKVFENSPFQVVGELWNKGAYVAREAYITATVETDYMCVTDGEKCIEQAGRQYNPLLSPQVAPNTGEYLGRTLSTPQGTAADIEFNLLAKDLDVLSVEHTSPVILTTCYAYSTELAQDICIDPDYASQSEKVCETKNIDLADQGAPIAITRIEPRIIQKTDTFEPQFLIYIQNKGDGEVVDYSKLRQACSSQALEHSDLNRVKLTSFWFSNEDYKYVNGQGNIECSPNPIRLTGQDDYILCKLKEPLSKEQFRTAFVTQAYVRLDYGYMKSVSKKVLIESTDR